MTFLRRIGEKLLRKASGLAASDGCCCECYDSAACSGLGPCHECIDGDCVMTATCEGNGDCPDFECCAACDCVFVDCLAGGSAAVTFSSFSWCGITAPNMNGCATFGQYGSGSNCGSAGGTTYYWVILNTTPDEVQIPGETYLHPVPGVAPPTGRACRYVWLVKVGYGNQPSVSGCITQPSMCEAKQYFMYIDIERCAPTGGSLSAVEDTSFDWSEWPVDCVNPCDTDADSCMSSVPSISITVVP